MPETGFIAAFLVGLLGGTHCVGMCGGIVGALSVQSGGQAPDLRLHLSYNVGRIGSYAAAGAAMGAFGSAGLLLKHTLPIQLAMYLLANVMLIALGLYLTGLSRALALTERAGQHLWRRIQPLTRRFLPARRPSQALALGALWGWLPCGLVYSVLATALVSGSALRGAALMLAFGLGTLPNLLFAGLALRSMQGWVRRPWVRRVAGLVVAGFGVYGLLSAMRLGGDAWRGILGAG